MVVLLCKECLDEMHEINTELAQQRQQQQQRRKWFNCVICTGMSAAEHIL